MNIYNEHWTAKYFYKMNYIQDHFCIGIVDFSSNLTFSHYIFRSKENVIQLTKTLA